MLAGGGDHDRPRLRVAVDVVDDRGKVDPGLRREGIEFGPATHDDMGHPVLDGDLEAGRLDGHAFLRARGRQAPSSVKLDDWFDGKGHSGSYRPGQTGERVRCASGWPTACIALAACLAPAAQAQAKSQDLDKIASDILHQKVAGRQGNLSKGDVTSGLKEALSVASQLAGKRLSAKDGFFGDPAVRIPLPGVLGDAQKRLQALRHGGTAGRSPAESEPRCRDRLRRPHRSWWSMP